MTNILDQVATLWTDHQAAIVLGVGAVIVVLLTVAGWRFYRSGAKSKYVGGVAAVTVLAWTSEGLWQVARNEMHLPLAFAIMTFFVFEAMMIAAGMRAEEHRKAKGVPGPAGRYVWILATCSGVISSLGAQVTVEYPLRVILPLLAVGLWWVGISAERDTDTAEMKAERQRLADEREATWTVTPRTILVRLGVMKPGKSTTTEAQREHQITRMVAAADTIAAGGRGVARARKRLRRLARTADAAMIETVAERVRQAVEAELLMVPAVAGQVHEVPVSRTAVPVRPERDGRDGGQDVPAPLPAPGERDVPVHVPAAIGAAVRDTRIPLSRGRNATRTDDELRTALAAVPRDPDGTIPPRRAATALGCGYDRAKRLIEEAGLLSGSTTNGKAVPDLLSVGSAQE